MILLQTKDNLTLKDNHQTKKYEENLTQFIRRKSRKPHNRNIVVPYPRIPKRN